jgi:Delta7-sterol 5-desaturase
MDLILDIADDVVLDKFWATILPLSAFSSVNGSSVASSQWSQLVSHLPRPQVSIDDYLYEPSSPYSYPTTFPDVSAWPRSYVPRQMLSISIITLIGVHIMYFLFATLSYYFIFNHDMMRHPRFLKNQVKLEIQTSLKAFPVMMLLTLPIFQGEVMGWSKLYKGLDTYGYTWLVLSVPW